MIHLKRLLAKWLYTLTNVQLLLIQWHVYDTCKTYTGCMDTFNTYTVHGCKPLPTYSKFAADEFENNYRKISKLSINDRTHF